MLLPVASVLSPAKHVGLQNYRLCDKLASTATHVTPYRCGMHALTLILTLTPALPYP